tara:strand:+ start:512 stop:1702 length:1191 start_codon:yes stop_codon:yes gene_type:complete
MPYKRVGKCVHKEYSNKKISKKPVGCSDTVAKAKEYIKALYANEMNEGKKMTPKEIAKREDIIKGMLDNKRSLVRKYGADAEKVMYGTATSKAKKIAEMESRDKLREVIKKALSKPVEEEKTEKYDDNPVLKGKQKDNLPDALQKSIIQKQGGKIEELESSEDSVDVVTMDVPLFLRMLEYAREDAQQDVDLHVVAEKAIELMKDQEILQMNDYNSIVGDSEDLYEDLDLGHQDDEPGMLKANVYDIGKYALELYKMLSEFDKMEGEVDFPHWWQSKIIKAKEFMSSAKHYLEFEINEPKVDAMVNSIPEMEDGLMETIKELKFSNPQITSEEVIKHIQEIKTLSEEKDSLCKRGKDYIKARKAAGEKSSAYLSGRAVKVCKGDIKFKGKKVDSYK